MNSLKKKYEEKIIPKMMEIFGYKNKLAVPKIKKIIINVGISSENQNNEKYIKAVNQSLEQITGQKPIFTKAKKSISAFKIREGMKIGLKITLHGSRMYDFLDKLINITLPRVRDFRGLEKKLISGTKSLTIGFKENIVFPEINSEQVDKIHGLEVSIVTNANKKEEMYELLLLMNFPFKKEKNNN